MVQNLVIAFVPVGETFTYFLFGCARLKSHERIRKIITLVVHLRRKVVCLRFSLPSDSCRKLIVLVQVVWNRAKVVEELAEDIPSFFPRHYVPTQQLLAYFIHRVTQQKSRLSVS